MLRGDERFRDDRKEDPRGVDTRSPEVGFDEKEKTEGTRVQESEK